MQDMIEHYRAYYNLEIFIISLIHLYDMEKL